MIFAKFVNFNFSKMQQDAEKSEKLRRRRIRNRSSGISFPDFCSGAFVVVVVMFRQKKQPPERANDRSILCFC